MSEPIDQKRIDYIDSLYWSPKERAEGVHQIVMEALDHHAETHGEDARPSFWDLVCWAVEYASQQSMVIQDPRFMAICVQLNRQMWQLHYSNAEDIYPREDKLETMRNSTVKFQEDRHDEEANAPPHPPAGGDESVSTEDEQGRDVHPEHGTNDT